jgi:poly-gamma-glutamate capsule biosynthesis protein CapA/YwtB (metallophosphatase superfamily)
MMKKILAIIFPTAVFFTAVFLSVNWWINFKSTTPNLNLTPIITPQPTPQSVSILFLGDVMLSRGVANQIEKNNNLYFPFQYIKEELLNNDFVFANLESPMIEGKKVYAGEMVFRTDEKLIPILKEMNFSIVSLANNHMLDMGQKGLLNTFKVLTENNIQYVGAGENYAKAHESKILEKNGIKFAFLAYNDDDVILATNEATDDRAGTAFMGLEGLKKDVANAKLLSDFVIVSMHSGNEYQVEPNQKQIDFSHIAIDSGADLVIGHHPHIIQKYEQYKNGHIFYSLGNCIFDQMWSEETREGIMAKIVFSKESITKIEPIPFLIENFSQPRIINREDNSELYNKILNKLEKIF